MARNREDEGGWGWGMLQQDRQEDGVPGSKAGMKSGFQVSCRISHRQLDRAVEDSTALMVT